MSLQHISLSPLSPSRVCTSSFLFIIVYKTLHLTCSGPMEVNWSGSPEVGPTQVGSLRFVKESLSQLLSSLYLLRHSSQFVTDTEYMLKNMFTANINYPWKINYNANPLHRRRNIQKGWYSNESVLPAYILFLSSHLMTNNK